MKDLKFLAHNGGLIRDFKHNRAIYIEALEKIINAAGTKPEIREQARGYIPVSIFHVYYGTMLYRTKLHLIRRVDDFVFET